MSGYEKGWVIETIVDGEAQWWTGPTVSDSGRFAGPDDAEFWPTRVAAERAFREEFGTLAGVTARRLSELPEPALHPPAGHEDHGRRGD